MRSNSRNLFFAIFAVLLAANLFAPAASLCKKCRKNKAAVGAVGEKPNEHDELFDSQKDEKTHVSQPGGQPKKEHSSEEESEEEKETTPTPLATAAPKRARRDQELRRDRELGEIATFTGHQKSSDHNDRNQHDRNRHHYHTIKRRQADDAHATHAHAADASCGEEGGGAKLNAEAKVDGATAAARRRRHALHARPYEREQREERARAVDTNVFLGPDSAQTDASGGGAPILVRKTRGIDHDKWRCPHDAEEEIMKMSERSDPPRKHEKRNVAANDDDDDRERERNAPLKHPSDVDLTDFLARKMEEHSRQPKGPFGGHRRGPVGPFPEPDIHLHGHQHRAHGTAGGGLIADRHFDLAEGIRRKLDADARKWEARARRTRVNADGSVDQRRAREMDEASAGRASSEDSSDSEPGATKMYKARELGERDDHRAGGVDSELQREKWLVGTGPGAGASLTLSRGVTGSDSTSQARTGASISLARSLKTTEPEASDEEEEDETVWADANDRVQVRVRRPRSSDRHEARLGEDVNRKLESELNREGRADESFVGQSPLAPSHQTPPAQGQRRPLDWSQKDQRPLTQGHQSQLDQSQQDQSQSDQSPLTQSQPVENPLAYLGYQGHHPHKHHKRPPTTRTTEDADEIRLGEDVRRKLASDLNRAGRAGDPNM